MLYFFSLLDIFLGRDVFNISLQFLDVFLNFADIFLDFFDVLADFCNAFGLIVERHLDEHSEIDGFERNNGGENEQHSIEMNNIRVHSEKTSSKKYRVDDE